MSNKLLLSSSLLVALLGSAGCRSLVPPNVSSPSSSAGSSSSPTGPGFWADSSKDKAAADAQRPAPNTVRSTSAGMIQSFADIVDHVAPAVVTIRAARRMRAPQQFPFADDPFLRQLFGGRFAVPQQRQQVQRSLGSGVLIRSDGHILTNHHVIDGAEDIRVDLNNRRTFTARLIGSDPPSDLALLKIDAGNMPVLMLGDSDQVRVGDIALAVGNPLGVGETVTAGIISAKGRATGLSDGSFEDFLQTDAPINQGNSGGALVNTRGELIGINSQILSPSGGNIGIGFAIPSNMAKIVTEQLARGGKVQRGQLGVTIQTVTSDLASGLGLKEVRGVLVNGVVPGGPAEKAGVQRGDVILQVNGQNVDSPNALRNRIAGSGPGSSVNMTLLRDGKQQQATVTLGALDAKAMRRGDSDEDDNNGGGGNGGAPGRSGGGGKLGLSLAPLSPDLAQQLGIRKTTQGLVVREVDPNGAAADAGLQAGDVIVEANRQPLRSTTDLQNVLSRSGNQPLLLLVQRQGQSQYVTVQPGG